MVELLLAAPWKKVGQHPGTAELDTRLEPLTTELPDN